MKYYSLFIALFLCSLSSSYVVAAPVGGTAESRALNEQGIAALRAGKTEKAEALLKKSYAADRFNLTAAYNLAGAYLANKKDAPAVLLLEELTTRVQDDPDIWFRLGDAKFSSQDPKGARQAYEKGLSLDPKRKGIHKKIATTYTLTNQLPEAEKSLFKAVEESPKDAQALLNLGSVLVANNKASEAVRIVKKSLQHDVSADAYITLGSAYEQLKDPKSALIAFEKAKALGTETKELTTKIKELYTVVENG